MKTKAVASGYLANSEKLIVCATVYYDLDEDGEELTDAGNRHCVLKLTHKDADGLATDALSYADIMASTSSESGAEEEVTVATEVPGLNGHVDVTLATPTVVTYSKTKSFLNKEGKPQVYAQMRFSF